MATVRIGARVDETLKTVTANMALALVFLARLAFACGDIAVLYGDGRYLLLDGDTLAVVDVGNLSSFGLFRIEEVVPGSSSRLFAVKADRLTREFYRGDEKGYYPSKLLVVENLSETGDTGVRIEVGHYDIGYAHARWIGGTDLLAAWREKASRFSVLGKDLQEVEGWKVSGYDSDATLACRSGHRVIVGGLRTRFEEADRVAKPLAFPPGATECRTSGTLSGCLAGFECRRNGSFVSGVLDLDENAVASAFEYESPFTIPKDPAHRRPHSRFEDRLLFAGGGRLLQQEVLRTPDTPGWNSYRHEPTSRLRVLTASGDVLKENKTVPAGTTSRLFCAGGKERFVVSGGGKAHLIDTATLETVATATIPQGWPFVF